MQIGEFLGVAVDAFDTEREAPVHTSFEAIADATYLITFEYLLRGS